MIEKVLKEANSWVGYLEKKSKAYLENFTANAGYGNYTIFAQQYFNYFNENYQGQPWCAMFVSCVFRNALGEKSQKQLMPHFSYCPTGVNQFKQLGCWYNTNPKKGDVVFFRDSSGVACHVGIIYDVVNNVIFTIEGNTSSNDGVVANGGAVCKKQYSINYNRIMGYGRPKYTVMEESWQQEYLNKLVSKGYIINIDEWKTYDEFVSKGMCVALIDKVTGGMWDSEESDAEIHWAHPHVISLCGKKIIQNKEEWLYQLDDYVSKAFVLALVDKATQDTLTKYKNITYDHWARANLNSLCDKGVINTPQVWCDDFDENVTRGNFMALICKAFNI